MRALSIAFVAFAVASFAEACKTAPAQADTTSAAPGAASGKTSPVTVIMVANLGEAEEQCGCGHIIRSVRAAGKDGVRVREVDTRNKIELVAATQKYRILVQPSVVMVDDADREVRRFEGENKDTVRALQAELERLVKKP